MEHIISKPHNIEGERFDSFAEFYQVYPKDAPFNKHYTVDYDAHASREVKDGTYYTWEQTQEAVMYGSDVFTEDFQTVLKEVNVDMKNYMTTGIRSRIHKDVVGQTVNVARAMAGHPKAFNHRVPVRVKQKTVHFIFNLSCSWSTTTQQRLKAGCILMAICKEMEKMGYQTKITYAPKVSFQSGSEPSTWPEICIKDYKTPFNEKKMQFALASNTMLAHLGWHWLHRTDTVKSNWGSGEGKSVDYSSERLAQAKAFAKEKGGIYLSIPMMVDDFNLQVGKAFDYVFAEMEKM